MKRVMVACVMAGTAATLFLGCGDRRIGDRAATDESTQPSVFIISEHSTTTTRGRFVALTGEVTFLASQTNADRSEFNLQVNGKVLEAALAGSATILDGHGTILDPVDRELLGTLGEHLDARFSTDASFAHDEALQGFVMYLAFAPDGYVHQPLTVTGGAGDIASQSQAIEVGGDEGIKCIKKNVSVRAGYTDKDGRSYSEAIMVGSNRPNNYGCMGRCGAGCSGFGGGWTKDCLDHDACSNRFNSKNGSRDVNCGDEYKAASDDFFRSSSCKG